MTCAHTYLGSTGITVPFNPVAASSSAPLFPPGEPLPFRVHRTHTGNLPVYSDTRSGGSKVVTRLRKYAGDVDALSQAVMRVCKSEVYQFHGRIEVKGKHAGTLKKWLTELGF